MKKLLSLLLLVPLTCFAGIKEDGVSTRNRWTDDQDANGHDISNVDTLDAITAIFATGNITNLNVYSLGYINKLGVATNIPVARLHVDTNNPSANDIVEIVTKTVGGSITTLRSTDEDGDMTLAGSLLIADGKNVGSAGNSVGFPGAVSFSGSVSLYMDICTLTFQDWGTGDNDWKVEVDDDCFEFWENVGDAAWTRRAYFSGTDFLMVGGGDIGNDSGALNIEATAALGLDAGSSWIYFKTNNVLGLTFRLDTARDQTVAGQTG